MIYVGSPSVQRGLATMIESLPLLPDWHAALVLPPTSGLIAGMLESAAHLGVADRLHVLPYVAHDEVVSFVRTADIGVIPVHHQPNHEISLATKYFEFAQARLPIVVSDVRTMAEVTRRLGNGLVFTADDTADFVARLTEAYARRTELSAAYTDQVLHDWSWPAQEEVLVALYERLLAPGDGPRG
jgi:glycosyltransferase involved in cell wall biosynthesis